MATVIKAKPRLMPKSRLGKSTLALGFDISPSSVAGCAKMRDRVLDKMVGPVWLRHAWTKDCTHATKLMHLAKAHEFVFILMHELRAVVEIPDVYIGVEDLPPRAMNANRYREQAELLGAFMGGLLRWGYLQDHVFFVSAKSWQAIVAADMEIPFSPGTKFHKWNTKEWVHLLYDIPKWPDLIRNNKQGLIAKPIGSKAMPEQPDDRYDATGIMEWTWERANESNGKTKLTIKPKSKTRKKSGARSSQG